MIACLSIDAQTFSSRDATVSIAASRCGSFAALVCRFWNSMAAGFAMGKYWWYLSEYL